MDCGLWTCGLWTDPWSVDRLPIIDMGCGQNAHNIDEVEGVDLCISQQCPSPHPPSATLGHLTHVFSKFIGKDEAFLLKIG